MTPEERSPTTPNPSCRVPPPMYPLSPAPAQRLQKTFPLQHFLLPRLMFSLVPHEPGHISVVPETIGLCPF